MCPSASSLIRDGITVNAIAPALIETDIGDQQPERQPESYSDGAFWLCGRCRIGGCDARDEWLHDWADGFGQWWLVHELVSLSPAFWNQALNECSGLYFRGRMLV
jgi:NAD(P)-dependent dehydrogenase (short-subunit alcohol dehydrogenase family)